MGIVNFIHDQERQQRYCPRCKTMAPQMLASRPAGRLSHTEEECLIEINKKFEALGVMVDEMSRQINRLSVIISQPPSINYPPQVISKRGRPKKI